MDSKEDEEVALPGFRFYPTDEELVGFYLRRKVDKKPTPMQLIKQIDIYKYDPWDLPKLVGDKEWYFFCKRGRKYRNSIRPNRVTGSGFWKATGIDKQIYSVHGDQTTTRDCIGLKKSLVYYRGSAGKGTKTDWMMHEFRLPPDPKTTSNLLNIPKSAAQEAEVWTLCRIFKRNVSNTKYIPNWREVMGKRDSRDTSSKTCSMEFENQESFISFEAPVVNENDNKKAINGHMSERNQLFVEQYSSSSITQQPPFMATSSSVFSPDVHDFFIYENWDDIRSGVEFAIDPFPP